MAGKIRAVTIPKWGLSMSEGLLAQWHVEEGTAVKPGDELFDVETTKITNAVEAPAGGTLRRRVAREGDVLPVGALAAVLAESGVDEAEIDAFVSKFQAEFQAAAAAAEGAPAGPEPQTAEVAGRRMNYLCMGETEGVPVVLVHGFGGDLNNWMFNQPALAERHRVYALDLPGHGASTKDVGTGDLDALAASVEGLLDAIGLGRVHWVGHSLGGGVVLTLALGHPDRVASLTLIAPVGLGADINVGYIDGFIQARRRKQLKPVVEQLFADPELISRDMLEELLKYKRLDGVEAALTTIAGAVFPQGHQAVSFADRLATISAPAQIVWGTEDRILPKAHASNAPETMTVHLLEDAGHMVHMEKATEVNRLIEALAAG